MARAMAAAGHFGVEALSAGRSRAVSTTSASGLPAQGAGRSEGLVIAVQRLPAQLGEERDSRLLDEGVFGVVAEHDLAPSTRDAGSAPNHAASTSMSRSETSRSPEISLGRRR